MTKLTKAQAIELLSIIRNGEEDDGYEAALETAQKNADAMFNSITCDEEGYGDECGNLTGVFFNVTFETVDGVKGAFCTGILDNRTQHIGDVDDYSKSNAEDTGAGAGIYDVAYYTTVFKEATAQQDEDNRPFYRGPVLYPHDDVEEMEFDEDDRF